MAGRKLHLRRVGTRLVMVPNPVPIAAPPAPAKRPFTMTKAELVELAGRRGVDASGSRAELIRRLS